MVIGSAEGNGSDTHRGRMAMHKIPLWGWIAIAVGAFLLLKPRAAVAQRQGDLAALRLG